MPQVDTEKHTRISKTKVKKFETAKSLFPTVSFQVGSSPSPLTVNRGRGQRIGRVPSWQENCYFATAHFLLMSSPFSMLQQIQIAAPCPVSSETGLFLQPADGDEILDGTLDGGFGQTRVVLSSIFRKFDSEKMKLCAGKPGDGAATLRLGASEHMSSMVSRATVRSFILTLDSVDGMCYLFADLCHAR